MNKESNTCCFQFDGELGTVLTKVVREVRQAEKSLQGLLSFYERPAVSHANLATRSPEINQPVRYEITVQTDLERASMLRAADFRVQSALMLPFLAPYVGSLGAIIGSAIGGVLAKLLSDAIDSLSGKSLQSTNKCCEMLLAELRKFRSGDGKVTKLTPQDPDPIPKSVKAAQEKLIDRTGSEEAAAALVRKVTAARGYREAERIYEEIFRDYGEKIARAVRTVEIAQRELWIGMGDLRANPDAAEAYKSAEDAQRRLTIEMGNGIQIHQKAIDIATLRIRVLGELSKRQDSYRLQIAKSTEAEALQNDRLRRFVQHGSEASEQAFNLTEQLRALTKTTASTSPSLATHSEHVGFVTEAYRELSAQVGDTIGDVLSGAVSFKEAWESLGRGVLDTVKHLGRQLLDSLLGSVRDMGRRLADVIFGQVQGALGSFGLGASRGFLPSVFPTALVSLGTGTPNRI